MGILADMVREVVDIDPSHIEKAPGFGSRGDGGLIAGIGEKDGHFIVILDVDAAFEAAGAFARKAGPVDEADRDAVGRPGEAR
jgi:purine-binding chemotaxis protein CheW